MSESVGTRIRKWFALNRITRMHDHYVAIVHEIAPRTKKDEQEYLFFTERFRAYYRRSRRLARLRFILYLFLYASVTINLFKAIPFLAFLVGFIEFGNAILGTTLILALIFIITMKVNLHLELMNECLTHLIALYHKNARRGTKKVLTRIRRTL